MKALGNKASPRQLDRLQFWKDAGAITGIAYNEREVYDIMCSYMSKKDEDIFLNLLYKAKK